MSETRVNVNLLVEGQLPNFVREEFPLVSEFLSQYYKSLEYQSGTSDILQNIDQYVKVDQLSNITDSTTLTQDVGFIDDAINVVSTYGFPDHYGLILIDDEIITYTAKTATSFTGCARGFSGVTSYQGESNSDQLVFSQSDSAEHTSSTTVTNLSVLFLKEFFYKLKKQVTPGFENRELYSQLNDGLFVKQSKDFYSSKGTDASFKILFGALYGKNVEIIRPRDYLIQPSDAQYRITKDLVVEAIEGDPTDLENKTLYQDAATNINKAEGTISNVEKIVRGEKEYYVISLDADYDRDINVNGTVLGNFTVHPKTRLISDVSIGSETLDVDSTVGFPSAGSLIIDLNNETSVTITYTSKTLNQFFGCSGITQNLSSQQDIRLDTFAYGYSDNQGTNIVKVRITGVLSDLDILNFNSYYSANDLINVKSLGKSLEEQKANNWFFNVSTRYEVKSVILLDSSDFTYQITLYDDHNLSIGDSVTLISSTGVEYLPSDIVLIQNKKVFDIKGQGILDTNLFYTIRKNLLKVNSTNYPELSKYTSNVQNVYSDLQDSLYVASPSLPTYLNQALDIKDRTVTFSGTFNGTDLVIGTHGFYTGDSVVYYETNEANKLDLINGVYFVKKVDDSAIRLARSKDNIFTNNYITVNGTVTNNKFYLAQFTNSDLTLKKLEPQKLIRKLIEPTDDVIQHETVPGSTGIFVNGVEVLNYKSQNAVYFGEIENIAVTASGIGYDILNPPVLTISDDIGSGANAYCSVSGQLERIDIIDPGFDYVEDPIITISGGNGSGATVKANLTDFDHSVEFNSIESASLVNLTNNTIGFSSHHKFRDAEEIIYSTQGGTNVGGLTTGSKYYASVQDAFTIKLHKTFTDAAVGINTIDLTSYGTGNHRFLSIGKKKKLISIIVTNAGTGYKNKKTTINSSGINTASNSILIQNHGYQSGEIITYSTSGSSIGGLSPSSSYYITKIDNNEFKLSPLGIGTEIKSFYYTTKQYIDLTSSGSGIHEFNYPPIEVSIKGNIGVSTLTGQNYQAVLQPIFRGSIDSVYIENGGTNYGSEEILNYNRQPQFSLLNGTGAQVLSIISNGRISEVLVKNGGSGYNSPPTLSVSGSGNGAILTPIIANGSLVEVKVISGGIGYSSSSTIIDVISAGSEAKFEAQIKEWRINLVESLFNANQISSDDGIVADPIISTFGLEYSHAYAARKLRSSVLAKQFTGSNEVFIPDLQVFNGKEVTSTIHSPIIGWAYDGNPIYGPYGYSTQTGGAIKILKSGYEVVSKPGRPSTSTYPLGIFVNDYEFTNSGDLDEHNGRFCITPDYPNGVYAYFSTINSQYLESVGPFQNYRKPVFPYLIGNTYKSTPIEFNFHKTSNQDDINLNETKWIRNTTPYNATKSRSYYDYLLDPNSIKKQLSIVKNSSRGIVDSIGIVTGGNDYQIDDQIGFDNSNTGGAGVIAKVSSIKGKTVSQVSVATSTISNIEFVPFNKPNALIGFATSPHNLLTNEIVTFSSLNDSEQSGKITVTPNKLTLVSGIGSVGYTGLVTYFEVSGSLTYPSIKENDIYQILTEQVRVLNIDTNSSRIRVLRNQNGTLGVSTYSAGIALTENSRKFEINIGLSTSYQYDLNTEFYFNPEESVGLGTTSGPGIGYTLTFTNPGVGITQINVPTQSIYLPNHRLLTGLELVYSSNGGTAVSVSTDGISSFQLLDNQIVYAAKLSDDLIGISTIKVGLGSTGIFVGIGSTSTNLLYFTNVGTGDTHSLTTNYSNILTGQISKNTVTVSTSSTHGLLTEDNVVISVKPGITTTVVLKYDNYNRRLIANPREFVAGDVNVINDTINIPNHRYFTGQKILHTATTALSGGLLSEQVYYVVVVNDNEIKLSNSFYESTKTNPSFVGITTAGSGTISEINPPIKLTKNNNLVFDVSDSSLSFTKGGQNYPAFNLNFYTDSEFLNKFESTGTNNTFEVVKSGSIGISSLAKVTLRTNDNFPNVLYYRLEAADLLNNESVKTEIITDNEVVNYNQILLVDSIYNGLHNIFQNSSTSFTYTTSSTPEKSEYTSSEAIIEYTTDSKTVYGTISSIELNSKGRNYKKIPKVSFIKSTFGNNAILKVNSSSIGLINKIEIQDIGFDYPSDLTVRPSAKLPDVLQIENLSSFKSIGISSVGRNYTLAPDLLVIDGITNQTINDVDLEYDLDNQSVTILKNTKSLSNATPTILPVNNINGVGISTIRFIESTKDVIVTLGSSFSNASDFPFGIGDKVLIEGIGVGIATTARGYNSSGYNYALFAIVNTDPNIGGIGATVSYNLTSYLSAGQIPGTFDPLNSAGRIIPQSHFPIFDIEIEPNEFSVGENVYSNSSLGVVQEWDELNGNLKVATNKDFIANEILIGQSSGTKALINNVIKADSVYNVGSGSTVRKGWNTETGFLNNDLQRIHDNDYYQYFSYSLKSEVEIETWNDPVSSLNHTAGFKKFSDLLLNSSPSIYSGISTSQDNGDVSGIADLTRNVSLNCTYDFDLASERIINISGNFASNEIVLNSQVVQDYLESIGNRVLVVDDLGNQFNSNPRPTKFSVVDTFLTSAHRYKKYIASIFDTFDTNERETLIISMLHDDGGNAYLNQYGRVETVHDLGSFDFNISGTDGQLLFFPKQFALNNYDISLSSYGIGDIASGIATCNLGDVVKIQSSTTLVSIGTSTATTIVGIASTYRSTKVLILFTASDESYFEVDEITLIHDNTNVELLEYGQLTTDTLQPDGIPGLGTYSAYISGSTLNIDFTPNVGLSTDYNVNTIQVSIANTNSVGVGTSTILDTQLSSNFVSIASSTSPTATVVSQFNLDDYTSAYYIVSIEDTTNNQYQTEEIIGISEGSNAYITEFGTLTTNSYLGDFSADLSGNNYQLKFTPNANIDCQVRVFEHLVSHVHNLSLDSEIDLELANIEGDYGSYSGTDIDIKKSFPLTYKELSIFERYVLGNDSSIVDLSLNAIKVPNHFFVTGEKISYTYDDSGAGTLNAIGISTTSIVGIGTTDKLPTDLYVVKVNDLYVRVAASASEALSVPPSVLTLSSVGIGTSHVLRSLNQNNKALISIDNVIQSPIVSTAITTTISTYVSATDTQITLSGITSFFGGDLIKIDNEIMKISSIGIGFTNAVVVERPLLGTGVATHAQNSIITKVLGNYNITNNTIHFVTAPYGLVPFSNPSNRADEQDYVGLTTGSTFSGRVFTKSGVPQTSNEPYYNNYIFDDISSQFNGSDKTFTLQTNNSNVTGFSTSNAVVLINQIFQGPARDGANPIIGDYDLSEQSGITSITFTGTGISTDYDVNTASIPRGGIIVSVASTEGFGYQPLVAAGGTAIVSIAGTIESISIGNSGSGYRSGIQTHVNVGVITESTGIVNIEYIGIATISDGHVIGVAITNPGIGYTSSNPPIVVFDDPLSYSNIPLIYSSSSVLGVGTGAVVDIVVGQGSSVINFEIRNTGYSYGQGEILTVATGGSTGIPTDTALTFEEFQIAIDRTQTDSFFGMTIGDLQVLDPIDNLFDGELKTFPLKIDGLQTTIRARKGSNIDIQATLLVFINDILQVPGNGYTFDGGSTITFPEPPKPGDISKLLFYKGNGDIDVITVDILETIKEGDTVQLYDDSIDLTQNKRLVTQINSTDIIQTNAYYKPGLTQDSTLLRPLIWCRQTEDKIINGVGVGKDRISYEPLIQPTTNIIQNVGISSDEIFVESVKTFFDHAKEYDSSSKLPRKLILIDQDIIVGGIATALVSIAGTISSIVISDGGVGYTTTPTVTISDPIGIGTTRATATATISSGSVTSISIDYPGYGYTTTNPPSVLIEQPPPKYEIIDNVSYEGDFGIIVGVNSTSVGVASTGIVFDFFIPQDSFLRDLNINTVGIATTGVSGIQTGYYFIIDNSNIGYGVTSLRQDGSVVGLGSTFIDNIYEVASVSIAQTDVAGVGLTYVAQVTVSLDSYNGLSGFGFSSFYGEYSWGRLSSFVRLDPKEFTIYNNGILGISTSPTIQRVNPLKYRNYNT